MKEYQNFAIVELLHKWSSTLFHLKVLNWQFSSFIQHFLVSVFFIKSNGNFWAFQDTDNLFSRASFLQNDGMLIQKGSLIDETTSRHVDLQRKQGHWTEHCFKYHYCVCNCLSIMVRYKKILRIILRLNFKTIISDIIEFYLVRIVSRWDF